MKTIFVLLCLVYGTFGVLLKDVGLANFPSPIGIDYHKPTDSLVMSVNYATGGFPFNLERFEFDGTAIQFGPTAGLSDEVKIATVKENDPIEEVGTLYVGNGVPGQITRVSSDGLVETNPWVSLPGESGLMRGSLYVDRTGVWNYDLVVCTDAGGVWRINRITKVPTFIFNAQRHFEGILVAPNDPAKYGFLAGKLLVGAENQGDLWWFSVDGTYGFWNIRSIPGNPDVQVEDIDLIEGNFYTVAYGISKLLGASASEFDAYRGDILLTMEVAGLFVLTWDFANNVPRVVPLPLDPGSVITNQYEHSTFAPFGILNIPDPEPPCDPEGTYHTQSEGDWGDDCSEGFQTGCYRDTQFAKCFPNGLDVGCKGCTFLTKKYFNCGFHLHFDTSADVANFLPQLGAPGVLDNDYFNPANPPPMSTPSGNFGGQVTALALSIGFSSCDSSFHTACGNLEDLYICDDRCERCSKRNDNNCKRNSNGCNLLRELDEIEEDELYERTNKNTNFNNNNNGKPKYANCEAFFNLQVKDIFDAAQKVLGGCADGCAVASRNNQNNNNCARNNACRKNPTRNNQSCSRNNGCKKNNNCCCCPDQGEPLCSPSLLNACVTLINQAFIFEKKLSDVDGGHLFSEKPCGCGNGFEWTATVNGQTVVLNPFVVPTDISTYYGYNKAGGDASSANTPDGLEDTNADKVLVEFVTDGFGLQNLLVIYDQPNSGSGGSAVTTITHSGNLDGADFIVQDDPNEANGYTVNTGSFDTEHNWATCCTDGYVLGPIPNLACFTFELGSTTGISSLRLASNGAPGGTALEVSKANDDTITVDICNRCKKN